MNVFSDPYSQFIYKRTYARWLEEESRREGWNETVGRFMTFMEQKLQDALTLEEYYEIEESIMNLEVLPSMRLLWTAGKAADKNNASAYNCSYVVIDDIKRFSEALFLLASGVGVGFSCEKKFISNLPTVKDDKFSKPDVYVIEDSREGWSKALLYGMERWYNGYDVEFDYGNIRPFGSRLKTFGGRASGPDPLIRLMNFTKRSIRNASGRKLRPIEVHDIMCMIGSVIVSGGVRRSSLISLSDFDDDEMRMAKSGSFPEYRYMANNSAMYEEKPNYDEFHNEWTSLVESGTGERGIFNREAAYLKSPERRKKFLDKERIGTNPCGEIVLNNTQLCNLTNIIVRSYDDRRSLFRKAKLATILGTYQSTLTNFSYLSEEWKNTCEEERLLGVSLTGIYDNPDLVIDSNLLSNLKNYIVKVNAEYAKKMGINPSTATTCVKPSGNSSQLVNCSSGLHPRYSKYYLRRVRVGAADPILDVLRVFDVPIYPENGSGESPTVYVAEFPVASPVGAITRSDIDAITHLEHWKCFSDNYAEHTVSATIYVGKDEWDKVEHWVYDNFDKIVGLSFLTKEDDSLKYDLAPYEEIDRDEYYYRINQIENLDMGLLRLFESSDFTSGAREYACTSGTCDII